LWDNGTQTYELPKIGEMQTMLKDKALEEILKSMTSYMIDFILNGI
jgi:hypothetical protein